MTTGPARQREDIVKTGKDHCRQPGRDERTGYFAALYYKVTSRVKDGIAKNEFEDGPRMEKLDVSFCQPLSRRAGAMAKEYSPYRFMEVALDSTKRSSILVLQHLLLGVNAHINLDLATRRWRRSGQPTSSCRRSVRIMTRSMRSSGR